MSNSRNASRRGARDLELAEGQASAFREGQFLLRWHRHLSPPRQEHTVNRLPLPQLSCPFPSRINPHTEEVHRCSVARWAERMRFLPDGPDYNRLEMARFAMLMGRCHPRANREDLLLIVDFATWLFYWDDRC